MAAKAFVDEKIASKKVVVFSKATCPFCAKALKALESYSLGKDELEVVELTGRPDYDEIMDYLKSITGGRTVPRVFIDKKCVGGGDEVQALHKSGKLKELLGK